MSIILGKIKVVRLRKPSRDADVNKLLQWFGGSLGLFGPRDRDRSQFRIFIEIIKETRHGKGISSDEMAYRLDLSRGTVIHHITKLMDAGILIRSGSSYLLRTNTLSTLVDEVLEDIQRTCEDIKEIAQRIDEEIK